MTLKETIKEIKRLESLSTPVVRWYGHFGEIRGPYNRWLTVEEPEQLTGRDNSVIRAYGHHDTEYAAAVMSDAPMLIEKLELAMQRLNEIESGKFQNGEEMDLTHTRSYACNALAELGYYEEEKDVED